jgi:hypothetical protein
VYDVRRVAPNACRNSRYLSRLEIDGLAAYARGLLGRLPCPRINSMEVSR